MSNQYTELEKKNKNNNIISTECFEFPLFSNPFFLNTNLKNRNDVLFEKKKNTLKLNTISVIEKTKDYSRSERPLSFYLMNYTEQEKSNIKSSAVTFADVLKHGSLLKNINEFVGHKCIDLNTYNSYFENENSSKKKKKCRPGKKNRIKKNKIKKKLSNRNCKKNFNLKKF